jgi:hypothetical protein
MDRLGAWFPPYVGASAVETYGKDLEETSAAVNPELLPYLELQQKIFDLADDLGIGAEVRTLYYTFAAGQRTGSALSTVGATVPILSGSAVIALAGTIASLLTVVGIIVGVISLFDGDDAPSVQEKRLRAKVEEILKRQSIDDLISEQEGLAQAAMLQILGKPANPKARDAALKLAALLKSLKSKLSADELNLFVSLSNLGRWEGYRAAWEGMKQSERDAVRQYTDLGAWLDKRIAEESARAKAIAGDLSVRNVRLVRAAKLKSRGGVVALALAAAIGGAALYYFAPQTAASLYHRAAGLGATAQRSALSAASGLRNIGR